MRLAVCLNPSGLTYTPGPWLRGQTSPLIDPLLCLPAVTSTVGGSPAPSCANG
jgi:hypothetical protein